MPLVARFSQSSRDNAGSRGTVSGGVRGPLLISRRGTPPGSCKHVAAVEVPWSRLDTAYSQLTSHSGLGLSEVAATGEPAERGVLSSGSECALVRGRRLQHTDKDLQVTQAPVAGLQGGSDSTLTPAS